VATIQITKEIEELLGALRKEDPAMSDAEILERALLELHRQRELERRRAWAASLPILELSVEEAAAIAQARKEAKYGPYTVEELLKQLKSDVDA
jgi:hypothetical protein